MKYIFNSEFIEGNEIIFYIFLIFILLTILLSIYLTLKEVNKNDNK